MENFELKQSFLNQILNFKSGCCHDNWDGENSLALSQDTIDHGLRFINKLEKYNLINDNLRIRPGSNTIIFTWKKSNSNNIATIEFDNQWDRLIWCIEDNSNIMYGQSIHLEEIVEKFKTFLGK